MLLLSSMDSQVTGTPRLCPQPGRLFIVGDPKQAIYRFRGADIETYLKTMDHALTPDGRLERLELTTNFRSVPSILRFVDAAFDGLMKKQEHYQSDYLAFGNGGDRAEEPASPSVHILGDRHDDGEQGEDGEAAGHGSRSRLEPSKR